MDTLRIDLFATHRDSAGERAAAAQALRALAEALIDGREPPRFLESDSGFRIGVARIVIDRR